MAADAPQRPLPFLGPDSPAAVVLDFGSALSKVGFSGADRPSHVFPTLVAHDQEDRLLFGDAAAAAFDSLFLSSPVARSAVTSWDDIQALWGHAFYDILQIDDTRDTPVVLTEPPLVSISMRERSVEALFEEFDVPKLLLLNKSLATLFSQGLTSGVVCDCGAGTTTVLPIYEGFASLHAIQRLEYGGSDVEDYIRRRMGQKYGFPDDKRLRFSPYFAEMKETMCYVAKEYKLEEHACDKDPASFAATYTLPDGSSTITTSELLAGVKEMSLSKERFAAPEIYFNPKLFESVSKSLPEAISESIAVSEEAEGVRRLFFQNVVLAGGSSCFRGFDERVLREVQLQAAPGTEVALRAADVREAERRFSVWLGGSVVAELKSLREENFITRAEFEEIGVAVLPVKEEVY